MTHTHTECQKMLDIPISPILGKSNNFRVAMKNAIKTTLSDIQKRLHDASLSDRASLTFACFAALPITLRFLAVSDSFTRGRTCECLLQLPTHDGSSCEASATSTLVRAINQERWSWHSLAKGKNTCSTNENRSMRVKPMLFISHIRKGYTGQTLWLLRSLKAKFNPRKVFAWLGW